MAALGARQLDEPSRVAAVGSYAILDTPPEPAFDRLTTLAARLFGAPMAALAFVDGDRQWLKSAVGLPFSETPRDVAFAAHTIASDEVLVVEDATSDPRFARSPLCAGDPNVRFYAGAPLIGFGGARLGALEIMDTRPRTIPGAGRRLLAQLAALAVEELTLRALVQAGGVGTGIFPGGPLAAMQGGGWSEQMTEQIPALLWATDRALRVVAVGGLTPIEFAGRGLSEVADCVPESRQGIAAHIDALGGERAPFELRVRGRLYRGTVSPWEDPSGAVRGTVSAARDVTDEQHEASKVEHADRLVSMGTLAAGVAHEINNPLTYVMANVGFVSERLAKLAREQVGGILSHPAVPGHELARQIEELRTALAEAQEGAIRVRQIVRDLRVFARGEEERFAPIDVRPALESAISMALTEIRQCARLVKELGDMPLVEASESRLGQVFLNLLMNAAQAVQAKIGAGDAGANEILVRTETDVEGRAVITIADTGIGITRELLGRIFEPFFTTKAVGIGAGLGLFICHGIVKAMHGELTVESTPGAGAVFRVVLPAARAGARAELIPVELTAVTPAPVEGLRMRVLLVDDDATMARTIERALAAEHDVSVVLGGAEAIATLGADAHFDAVLCDLMMPNVSGMDVFAAVERHRPALAHRMIFFTGGPLTPRAREFLATVSNARFDKPPDLTRLREALRALAAN